MVLLVAEKSWDRHVAQAELVARTDGFQSLRDGILERARIETGDTVVDIGASLLTLSAESAGQVWAVDVPRMCDYLATKARSAGREQVELTATRGGSSRDGGEG